MTSDSERGATPENGELLWNAPAVPSRGPRRGLTLDGIAEAAVQVADRDGLAALSMQRVAAEVGVTKMALYRYVAGKPELEALMIDAAVEEPPGEEAFSGDWRQRMEEFARLVGGVWERHPWLPWIAVGRRLMGPREVGWIEAAMRIMDGTPLDAGERMAAVSMVFGHIRSTQSVDAAGTQPWSAGEDVDARLRELLAEHRDRFPALAAATSATGSPAAPAPGRAFGLRCLLDGLQTMIDERSG